MESGAIAVLSFTLFKGLQQALAFLLRLEYDHANLVVNLVLVHVRELIGAVVVVVKRDLSVLRLPKQIDVRLLLRHRHSVLFNDLRRLFGFPFRNPRR